MRNFKLEELNLKEPLFFTISNLGGGGSDKYREVVYADLLKNTPTLFNYYYLKYGDFATGWLREMGNYENFSDFLDYVRKDMIYNRNFFCSGYEFQENYSSRNTCLLLDSGASNIKNKIIKNESIFNIERFKEHFSNEMIEYYKFADRFKFHFVIGFDIGGKYTFKGEERTNETIINNNLEIERNSSEINSYLLEKTIEFYKGSTKFFPKIYAPVHGKTPDEYRKNVEYILFLEKKYGVKFFGFALGGIASSKQIIKEDWNISDDKLEELKKLSSVSKVQITNCLLASYACRIVKEKVGDRPIHALGAGNILNIIPLTYFGATSFDSQTPGRRAYDGNSKSSANVFNICSKDSFSKYLIGLLDKNFNAINNNSGALSYKSLNLVNDEAVDLCGCPICSKFEIEDIKKLYNQKEISNEYYYLARQLLNGHSVWQHNYLCKALNEDKLEFLENSSLKNLFIKLIKTIREN